MTTPAKTHSVIKPIKKEILRNNERYGIQKDFDILYAQSKEGHTFCNLYNLIIDDRNLMLAYRNIRDNKGSLTPGVNGHTIQYWTGRPIEDYLEYMKKRLKNFFPHKVKRVEIPKPNGKVRPLGIPTIEDRLIQQSMKQVLEPICEAKFFENSYGFRPNRGTVHAIADFNRIVDTVKLYYIISFDIEGFFDNVDHAKLKRQIWSLGIHDKRLLAIIAKMLKAEIVGEGVPDKGTPQGGVLSPLLANIVLNELDYWVANQWRYFDIEEIKPRMTSTGRMDRGSVYRKLRKSTGLKEMHIVRYADDFKIFCRTYSEAERTFEAVRMWLKERLHLEINMEKSGIRDIREKPVEFLGFKLKAERHKNSWSTRSHIAESAKVRICENIKNSIRSIKKNPVPREIMKYNSLILGVQEYYRSATAVSEDLKEIEYKVKQFRYNQLKNIGSYRGTPSLLYQKRYGNRHRRIFYVNGIPLFPLNAQRYVVPRSFSQGICNYTESGRKMIHHNLRFGSGVLKHLMENIPEGMSSELANFRVSAYLAQIGRCAISGKELNSGNMELHHVIPKQFGGKDEYQNLKWVTGDIHKLIHMTNPESISRYLVQSEFDITKLGILNKYRVMARNDRIVFEDVSV